MKKVFDQTVRDIKREVNKKVLKVPSIEQKVLDITSNEPWGPHGSVMADIAQATRNYHEYQMIMGILWKRLNDTGKNWRHVYKALTVLEYLVGNGSERVIDDLREHAYQISTLKDFQYIDHRGRDQGQNVRKKSHALVTLLNDKERIREVREKASVNKDKYRGSTSGAGYGDRFDDDRYGSQYGGRDDDRNSYGRDRDWDRDRYRDRDDERSSYGRDNGDRYGPESGERYSRDGDNYRNDEFGGDKYHDEGRNSRSEYPTTEDRYERKQSEGSMEAPPSYEEAVSESVQPDERGRSSTEGMPVKPDTQVSGKSQDGAAFTDNTNSTAAKPVDEFDDFDPRNSFSAAASSNFSNVENDLFGSSTEMLALPAPSTATGRSSVSETNLAAALFSTETTNSSTGANAFNPVPSSSNVLGSVPVNDAQPQAGHNPFGDPPFKAAASGTAEDPFGAQTQSLGAFSTAPTFSFDNFQSKGMTASRSADNLSFPDALQGGSVNPFETMAHPTMARSSVSDTFQTQPRNSASDAYQSQPPPYSMAPTLQPHETMLPSSQNQTLVPPSLPMQGQGQAPFLTMPTTSLQQHQYSHSQIQTLPPPYPQVSLQQQHPPMAMPSQGQTQPQPQPQPYSLPPQPQTPSQAQAPLPQEQLQAQPSNIRPPIHTHTQSQPVAVPMTMHMQTQAQAEAQVPSPAASQALPFDLDFVQPAPASTVSAPKAQDQITSSMPQSVNPYTEASMLQSVNPSPAAASSVPNKATSQQKNEKFQPKSGIWAETLSRGLVDLNISGPKINPLADIGIDFDSINRKEKLKEKSAAAAALTSSSNQPMGKAMGSGSGFGRAGAAPVSSRPNPVPGSMGMGMGMGSYGMAMGASAGLGTGMGMGMNPGIGNMSATMGMGINAPAPGMGMGMRPQMGMPGGVNPNIGGYGVGMNPNINMGGYPSQQQHPGFR